MGQQAWLDSTDITFPLAAATKLITGDDTAPANFTIVEKFFTDHSVGPVFLIDRGTTVSLREATTVEDWISETEWLDTFRLLAPIIADGCYAELTSTSPVADSVLYRLVIAGDGVVEDYPRLTWDDPHDIAAKKTGSSQ